MNRSVQIAIVGTIGIMGLIAFGQSSGTVRSYLNGRPSAIPNPNDDLALVPFVVNSRIAHELNLSSSELTAIKKLLRENKGSLAVSKFTVDGDRLPTPEEIALQRAEHQLRVRQVLDEIITPDQWKRLKQIAYHVEVSRIGYGRALTEGWLGTDIGVYDNQKANLIEKSRSIEAKASEAINAILLKMQVDILAELTPEQRSKAREKLGSPFLFRDETFQYAEQLRQTEEQEDDVR